MRKKTAKVENDSEIPQERFLLSEISTAFFAWVPTQLCRPMVALLMKKCMAHFRLTFCNSMLEHILMPAGVDC